MALDCCCRILRCVLIVVNLLVTVAGIAMIISGVLMLRTIVDLNMYPDTNSTDEKAITYYASIGLLVGGSLMTLIGICGSCGALHESQCLLTTFVLVVLTCFGLSVTGIVMLTMHDKTIVSMAVKQFNELNGTEKIKFAETLKCCISEQSPKKNTTCQYEENCDFERKMSSVVNLLTTTLAVAGIIQVFSFVSSLGLCCQIRKSGY